MTILTDDAQYCWHPFTQAQTANPPLVIERGHQEFLYDDQQRQYFDAVSSWWVNLHGHTHPHIAQAIAQQAQTLEHTLFAGITHPPAVQLAKQLIELAPPPMAKVFYSDNGSTAIEVALKMAFQYWQNQGQRQRTRILALQGGYHGDTFGAMSAGQSSGFYDPFKPWLFQIDTLPVGQNPTSEAAALEALEQHLTQRDHEYAALILEPLVQGASGMRMMRPEFVAALCKRCTQAGLLVIFDEVFTGFYRTGSPFAAHQVAQHGGQADIICLSKGLTGGFMPMAATLTSQAIYDAFLSDDVHKALLHGHSYTANPLGCAAALASLQLLQQPDTQTSIQRIQRIHHTWLPTLQHHPELENPRICGTIAAFELKSHDNQYGSASSQWIRQTFLALGIIVRPLGHTVYWVPPYCTQTSTLEHAYNTLMDVLARWKKHKQTPNKGSELF